LNNKIRITIIIYIIWLVISIILTQLLLNNVLGIATTSPDWTYWVVDITIIPIFGTMCTIILLAVIKIVNDIVKSTIS
jgi:hypothetical protein